MRSFRALAPLLASGAVFATSRLASNINTSLLDLVQLIKDIVPIVVLALFILAGLVYALGQVFDAATRQKAQNWAMAMIVGGVVGILIVIIAPFLVDFLVGMSGS